MKKYGAVCVMLCGFAMINAPLHAEAPSARIAAPAPQAMEYKTAQAFLKALSRNDRIAVANMVSYPYPRPYPLSVIETPEEFAASWDDFFDAGNTPVILTDTYVMIGDKGLMFQASGIWVRGDNIIPIASTTGAKHYEDAKAKEEKSIHESLRGYTNVFKICETETKRIRVQQKGEALYYFSWPKTATFADAPDMTLTGTGEFQGTMGGVTYTFKNGDDTYVLDVPYVCEDPVCKDTLSVHKGSEQVSSDTCD